MAPNAQEKKTVQSRVQDRSSQATEDPERSVASVASSLGVSISTLHSWKRKHSADGSFAFLGHGKLKPVDGELRKLKKDLAEFGRNEIYEKRKGITFECAKCGPSQTDASSRVGGA